MEYVVLLRIDSAGMCPVVAGPDTDLSGSDDARWRYVGETDDEGEAYRMLGMLHGRIQRGEL